MQTILYFGSILLTCALTGFLGWYARRQGQAPGARVYMGLAFGGCLLALAETLSMLSPTRAQALFWFNARFLFFAFLPVFWLVFALEYSGQKGWLSKSLLAGFLVIPATTQVILWSNSLHGLWVRQEVSFHHNGPFWIAETSARIPGLWFPVYSFYGLILLLTGIGLMLVTAWRRRRWYRRQALLVTVGALVALVTSVIPAFNLNPQAGFSPFIPGLGLSALLMALAVFRFQFLKHGPTHGDTVTAPAIDLQANRSLALFLFIFVLTATGIAALGYLSYLSAGHRLRAQVESQLSSIAALKVNELREWREERLGDAELLHHNPTFSALVQRYLEDPPDARAQAALRAWLDGYRAYGQFDRIFLLDSRGAVRLTALGAPESAPAHVAREVPAVLSAGQVVFLDFYRDAASGLVQLALLVPIPAVQAGDRPLGMLVLRIDPHAYLYPYLQQWPVPSANAETLLVRREGTEVVFLNELRFQANAALNLRFSLERTQLAAVKAVLGQVGIVEGVDYRGVPVIADVRAVPGSPWFLVARVDITEMYAPLRERLWQLAVFLGALVVASGAALGLVWRRQRERYYRGQVEAAQALRASERQFRTMFELASVGMAQADVRSGRWLRVNDKMCEITGYSADEMLRLRLSEVTHPEDRARDWAAFERVVRGEAPDYRLEKRYVRKDGRVVWVNVNMTVIRDASGQPTRTMATIEDITERKRAEETLRRLLDDVETSRRVLLSVVEDQKQAETEVRRLNAELEQRVRDRTAELEAVNQELETFSYSVSHDLRAPLRAINGYARILTEDHGSQLDGESQRVLGVVRAEALRMGQLIDDLLEFSRLGHQPLRKGPTDMTALVREAYADVSGRMPHRTVHFHLGALPAAPADPALLRQVWFNLLDNALKFTRHRERADIAVAGSTRAGEAVYSVKDNGAGFDMKYADKLFGVFQRMHRAEEFEGTGVGLALVQRVVHRHGGRVWAEAEPDRGATFYFTLPVSEQPVTADASSAGSDDILRPGKRTPKT